MSRDTYIFIAFCVFALLLGMRIRQRLSGKGKKDQEIKSSKNQQSKAADVEEPPLVKERRLRRERRVRLFTMVQLVVVFGLIIYMIPALMRDITMPGDVDFSNFFLRCLIFLFAIYLFVLGYIKVFRRKEKN